jgi:hypothetical protein
MTISPLDSIPGTVTDAGKLVFQPSDRARLSGVLRGLRGTRVDVLVVEHRDTRSGKANAYYWSTVVKLATAYTGDTPEDFHDEMCARFLTRRRIEVLDYATGAATEIVIPGRSSKLKIGDFYTFVEQVRLFCAEFLEVSTPDPDPEYWRKRTEATAA